MSALAALWTGTARGGSLTASFSKGAGGKSSILISGLIAVDLRWHFSHLTHDLQQMLTQN